MKKLMALLATAAMAACMCVPAFAADGAASISVQNAKTGHTYEAYQIFVGDVYFEDSEAAGVLSNIEWGTGVTEEGQTALLSFGIAEGEKAYANAAELAAALNDDNAEAFANAVAPYLTSPAGSASEPTGGKYVIDGLVGGYYLVKDKNGSLAGENDAYTAFILEVVGDVTVEPKSAQPTVDKQVLDEAADAEAGSTDGWGETADHAINESFQFKLIATIPADADLAAYETYQVVFTDTMSAGVTFENIVSVKVNGVDAAYTCSATEGQAGGSWTLTIADVLVYDTNLSDGATIEVVYNAHLNAAAVIGNEDENLNKVYLQYSNNPNASAEGDWEFGQTVEDTVWVFTYLMDNTKVNGEGEALEGAGFKLFSDEACTQAIALVFDEALAAYRPAAAGETGVEMLSSEDGSFDIKGLDAGTYYLRETLTPAGYNTCADVVVVISAAHAEGEATDSAATTITMTVDGKAANAVQVVNQAGTELPSTGGMGTVAFYVVGALMAVAAVVLLFARRRGSESK